MGLNRFFRTETSPLEKPNPRSEKLGGGLAERTGLEPATSGVTGRRSNQLNYRSW